MGTLLLPSSTFLERFLRLNGLDAAGFGAWDFVPGMRFGERTAWWRGGANRDSPHEGLDLCSCRTRDGRRRDLGAGSRVPAVWPGRVVEVVDDFLGRSVFVSHEFMDPEGRRLHSVYGHVVPAAGTVVGSLVSDFSVVGMVAAPAGRTVAVPPHLHLTLALILPDAARLDWKLLREPSRAILLDPLPAVV